MSELKPLDLSGLSRKKPKTTPVAAVVSNPPLRSSDFRNWVIVALIATVAFMGFWMLGGRLPTPNPGPVIDAEGLHVLIVKPSNEAGMSDGQKDFLKSAKVAEWVDEQGGKFRSYPESQDMSNEEQVWRDMRAELSPPFVVGILEDRKLKKLEAPDGIEPGIQALQRAR
jgi:hypothetical protein